MPKMLKIILDLNGYEIGLTFDEAKELKLLLDDLFKEEKTVHIPSSPVIIERESYWRPYNPCFWKVTCDANVPTYTLESGK